MLICLRTSIKSSIFCPLWAPWSQVIHRSRSYAGVLFRSMLAEGLIEVDLIYPYSPSTYACFQKKCLPNLFLNFQNLEKECWIHGDMLCSMLGLEEITFTYYGMRNQKFDVAAVCQTEGGPEQLRFSSGKPRCGVHFIWTFFC